MPQSLVKVLGQTSGQNAERTATRGRGGSADALPGLTREAPLSTDVYVWAKLRYHKAIVNVKNIQHHSEWERTGSRSKEDRVSRGGSSLDVPSVPFHSPDAPKPPTVQARETKGPGRNPRPAPSIMSGTVHRRSNNLRVST